MWKVNNEQHVQKIIVKWSYGLTPDELPQLVYFCKNTVIMGWTSINSRFPDFVWFRQGFLIIPTKCFQHSYDLKNLLRIPKLGIFFLCWRFHKLVMFRSWIDLRIIIWKKTPNCTDTELQISCVFAFFTQWKRVKTHVLSDQSVHLRIHIAV
jgi:hypothetical protein